MSPATSFPASSYITTSCEACGETRRVYPYLGAEPPHVCPVSWSRKAWIRVKWWFIWLYESVLYEVYKIRHRKSEADMRRDYEEVLDLLREALLDEPVAEEAGKQSRGAEESGPRR